MAFNSLCLFSKSSLVDRSLLIWPEFHHPILQKALHSDGYLLGLKRADEGPFESDVWLSAASPALSPFSPVFPTSIFGPGALGARLAHVPLSSRSDTETHFPQSPWHCHCSGV